MDKYRIKYFKDFNKNILFSKEPLDFNKNKSFIYDFCLVGSDQVWNPLMCRLKDADLLKFIDKEKRISFSASFGIEEIPNSHKYKKDFENFKAISVREEKK